MTSDSLFGFLEAVIARPAVFSRYTARDLWTDAHTSAQMLSYHLNEDVDLSSRRATFIDRSVRWLTSQFSLVEGSRVADFGCGPGLYAARLATQGADVVGIDFSARSIDYARKSASEQDLTVTYVEADYLDYEPDGKFDLIIMIMCDFCALSPTQRAEMLSKFRRLLSEQGHILIDVYSAAAFASKEEHLSFEKNQLNGFWSARPYYAFVSNLKYDAEMVSLDRYTIIEEHRHREVYNWLQHFTPETLKQEVQSAGLDLAALYGDVAGSAYDAEAAEFAAVLKQQD